MKRNIQIISAASILGLRPSGVEKLPETLIRAGLAGRIKSTNPIVTIPTLNDQYDTRRDPETNCLNPSAIHDFSITLMKQVAQQIDKSVFPLILGGDCSILIGVMPALKLKGMLGLIFVDAHADFYQPEKSTTGEVADMDLAIVSGRGPEILTNIQLLKPYVEERNIIHMGQRDAEETKKFGSQDIAETAITRFDLASIKAAGIKETAASITNLVHTLEPAGFWIHFDTDVISDEDNPAVEYRLPGGLSMDETSYLLNQLLLTEKITGMSVTIFNPTLDKTGQIAIKISECLASAFGEMNSSTTDAKNV